MKLLKDEGAEITPIISAAVQNTDSRFGTAKEVREKIAAITDIEPITTIVAAEPIGPQNKIDIILVAPCTGNTLARLALGITDSSVTMACKAQLRNKKPVVLAIATNDGLSGNARNLGTLLNRCNVFFVPFGQDAPVSKQTSLVAKMSLIPETILEALQLRQYQPLLVAGGSAE